MSGVFVFTYPGAGQPNGLMCLREHERVYEGSAILYLGLDCAHTGADGYAIQGLDWARSDYLNAEHARFGHAESVADCGRCGESTPWGMTDARLALANWRRTFARLAWRFDGTEDAPEARLSREAAANLDALEGAVRALEVSELDPESVHQQALAWADWKRTWNARGLDVEIQ